MKKLINTIIASLVVLLAFSSCSDQYMTSLNTDPSKSPVMDPNAFLTTGLLQTYGDFGMMDTYRSYITGFTQHMAGGWNVSNYAGSVHANNDQMRLIWDRMYGVGIKNLVEGIDMSADMPNLNAIMRIHRVYLLSILTDTYGDVPCMDAGKGEANPKYDTQKDIYDFFFTELAACAAQLGTGEDEVTGDVTAYDGNVAKWKKYANSLRLRFAMRISDVDPTKAKAEFEAALADEGGIIAASEDDAYINYIDAPFTLYDGSRDLDFRANALGEILYGQDPESPSFVGATLFNQLKDTSDPRLYRICRHYINTLRSDVSPDDLGNVDVTDEVRAWEIASGLGSHPCLPGAAWWDNWVSAPSNEEIPTLAALVEKNPTAGYDKNNYNVRMIRPFLNINFERPNCPGILMTSAEVEFLLAEAADKGWSVTGSAEDHFKAGITASMKLLNEHYLPVAQVIADNEINTFISDLLTATPFAGNARNMINTQAWILHLTNPSECWANLRRADYPVLMDRTKLAKFPSDFTYDDEDLSTPTRLRYPDLENQYNSKNYEEAIGRAPLNGKDNWHARMWWDTADIHVQ